MGDVAKPVCRRRQKNRAIICRNRKFVGTTFQKIPFSRAISQLYKTNKYSLGLSSECNHLSIVDPLFWGYWNQVFKRFEIFRRKKRTKPRTNRFSTFVLPVFANVWMQLVSGRDPLRQSVEVFIEAKTFPVLMWVIVSVLHPSFFRYSGKGFAAIHTFDTDEYIFVLDK